MTRLDGQRPELVTADRRAVVDDPDRQWRAKTAHLNLSLGENIKRNAGCRADDIRDDQLAIVFLGKVLQSRSDVDDLADRGGRRVLAITEGPEDDLAAMDADADFERFRQFVGERAVHLADMPIHQAGRLQGLRARLLRAGFGAENRHHPVADELVGRAAGRRDGAADRLEEPVQDEDDVKG